MITFYERNQSFSVNLHFSLDAYRLFCKMFKWRHSKMHFRFVEASKRYFSQMLLKNLLNMSCRRYREMTLDISHKICVRFANQAVLNSTRYNFPWFFKPFFNVMMPWSLFHKITKTSHIAPGNMSFRKLNKMSSRCHILTSS